MPKVSQQTMASKPTSASVLGRVAPVKPVSVDRQKWAVYGVPKSGKTRFASTFKKPLLVIGAEDGTASIAGVKGIDFVQVQSLGEFDDIVSELPKMKSRWKKDGSSWKQLDGPFGDPYSSSFVDTLSKLRDIHIVNLFKEMGMEVPERKPFLFADKVWKSVWTQCGKDLKDSLRVLLDYPRTMALNVLVISQEANLVYDDGNASASSDIIRPAIGSAVGKSLCDWLHAECDYIGQAMIREQVVEKPLLVDGKPSGVSTQAKTGKKEYCLRVVPDGVYQAGFRLPMGRTLDVEYIVNPTYDKVCALIRGDKTK